MKKLISLLIIALAFAACSGEGSTASRIDGFNDSENVNYEE